MSAILGINTFHAGAAAALVIDGRPVAAIAEERLNRVKYYARFPALAIRRCLDLAGLRFRDIDALAIGRDSSANRMKKIQFALKNPTRLLSLYQVRSKRTALDDPMALLSSECQVDPAELRCSVHHIEHHVAHIASSYFISEWDEACGVSIDGSGDFVTSMMAHCKGSDITVKNRVYVPHSLGSFYTMICELIGYQKYGDEGKVMGLAPYGTDKYVDAFGEIVRLTEDGMTLNPAYFVPFGENQGLSINDEGEMVVKRHYSDQAVARFGPPRQVGTPFTQREMDLAFAMQRRFEDAYMHLLNIGHRLAPSPRVALAGGCALNSVANGKLFSVTPFRETCIQPAAGDEGLSLGAALYVSNSVLKENKRFVMNDAYLGPAYSDSEILADLEARRVPHEKLDREALLRKTVDEIVAGNVIGWFQGRMEWGPRALGNRSILVHPGLPDMKDTLNARIKNRESFRPFAPAVLADRQSDLFEHTHPSPFMLHVYKIRPAWRERLCAVNHADDTGRLQTVARDENPLYYDLISEFDRRTGIPVLLNTSFNENEPIVCCPAEAIDCFLRTKMDVLAIGSFLCKKKPP